MENNDKKDYKIHMTEILKEIEKFKIVNKIIEVNIAKDTISITNTDLGNFKLIIQYLLKHDVKQNLKYVAYNYSNYIFQNYITPDDKYYFLKQFLLLITFLNHYSTTIKLKEYNLYELLNTLLKLIRKLYLIKIFSLKEIAIVTKYTLILSLFRNVTVDAALRLNKSIKNVLVWVAITFFAELFEGQEAEDISDELNYYVNDILSFFEEKFISTHNISFFGNTLIPLTLLNLTQIDELNKENREQIYQLLGRIYEASFDFGFYSHVIEKVRTGLVNITNHKPESVVTKDIRVLDSYIELMKVLNTINRKNNLNEPYYITHGFNFSGNSTGIILQPMLSFPDKGYTLTFSFKWIPEKTNSSKLSLLAFIIDKPEKPFNKKEDFKDFIIFNVFIENSKLCISTKETWNTDIEIQPYTNHLITIKQAEKGILKKRSYISVLINNNIFQESSILGYPSGNMKCLVGYLTYYSEGLGRLTIDYFFTGNIGTILLFNKLFPLETIERIHDLKKDYEKILFFNYSTYLTTERKTETLLHLKNSKIKFEESLFMIISAKVIFLLNIVYTQIVNDSRR
jgi:hypothetical protein